MSTHQPNLNPALISKATEFFAYDDQLYCLHDGRRYLYEETPEHIREAVRLHLAHNTVAKKALAEWARVEEIDELRQYTFCLLGGHDCEPDIDEQGHVVANEYHDCGKRGSCRFEGKVCPHLAVANGRLTKTELEFLKRAHKPNKIIADEMYISEETVNSHVQNVLRKTGFTRAELVRFAAKKGIN